LACKEKEIQSLKERVVELERQLAQAQAAAQALTPLHEQPLQFRSVPPQEPEGQAEIDLRNTLIGEASVKRAIKVAPFPLMIRRDDGRVMLINAAWTKISGYTLEDIPTIDEWTHKAYGEGAPQRKLEILNEGFSQPDVKQWGEYEITTRSGEKRIWDFSTAPLGVDPMGRRLVMAMAVDITERKYTEEKLRAARDEATWLGRFPNENPNPVVRVSKEGIVLYCNPPAASLRGWRCAVDAALSRPLLDLVEAAVEQGQTVEQDLLIGEKFYAVSVIPIREKEYLNLYGRDITERVRAEKALEESERRQREITRLLEVDQSRLAAVLQHLPVGVWIADQTGRLIGSNEQADRIWAGEGPLPSSTLEYQEYEAWSAESGELLQREEYPLAMALQTGQPVEPMELRIRRFDGTEGTVLASAAPIKDRQGLLTGAVGVNLDITERKQAEAHINDLLALNEKILNHSSVGILTYKVTGQCVFANEKMASIVGTRVGDLLTQNFHTIESWRTSGLYDLVQQAISTQAPATADIHHLSTFGKDIWITVHCITFQSRGEDHVLLSFSDITERRQAEQAVLESERRLKRAQEIAHLGSWELDLITDRLTWSDEVYRIFGLQPQEFAATYEAFLQAVHPDDRAAVDAAYSGSIREGRNQYEIEHRVVRRNGEIRIVHEKCEHFRDQSGQIIRSMGMVHDITERKQAEEALQESETRFRSLADSMPQLVWTALPDGTVDYYNQRYHAYLDVRLNEDTPREWAEVLHPDDRESTLKAWTHSIETDEIYQIEHRVQIADGLYRWHLSRAVPARDDSGQITRWYGTTTDIHDLKQAEEQLKVYASRLEHSNRELEQFAFMASHDMQEPLRKIEMYGDMLQERAASLTDQERNYVERMRNAAGRMRDMVEGLLQLSRVTTQGKPFGQVDLARITREVLHDLEGQIQRTRGKVNVETLPVIEGDALQLHQLLQNLIGNALKYQQPGIPPEVHVSAKHLSGRVQILVQDKGIGFAEGDAERVFQPFQRLVGRSQYEGSGIGLAICRRIVERHGGEISALSKPGHGALFIVTLPTS
jgi:PAS domain S-box-containing protein